MSAKIDPLPPQERVVILTKRLANLQAGSGIYRPCTRSLAINECRRGLEEAQADLRRQA